MKDYQLLVTCCNQGGGLYNITIKNGTYELKKLLPDEYRGIAKYKEMYVIVSNDKISLLNSEFEVIKTKILTLALDLHGVAIYNDQVFIVETKTNSIGIYDLNKGLERVDEIKLSPQNNDVCHINDIFIQGDKAYISMFFYHNKKGFLIKESKIRGVIIEYSLLEKKTNKIMAKQLFQPHSVKVYNEGLFYCQSEKFLVQKNKDIIFKGLGYLRGLDVKDDVLFIGQSESRHVEKLLEEHSNILLDCGIYVHNMSTKMSSFIHVPSKEIYQILAI
ncbi:DUF4915 domain-containing protein [Bacillus sp. SA1-12]|uniref:DUF4915 domain-containing protein n=1 Tax=Bacillus sp. SA1-12 TaxID=1455638 RepID=UPI001E517AF7|nr:DUF4915 domain-containing protein [Bacillus sp. SA1-12]